MAKKTTGKRKKSLAALIDEYYVDLDQVTQKGALFELGVRYAFHHLMVEEGKRHGWTLIGELQRKVGGKTIQPDGTFKDDLNLVRGYWEAKDTSDVLEKEIEKKRKLGYPLNNTIFEDTATAVLFQHGQRILTVDMKDPARLAELVTQFFRHVEPEVEEFEKAVDEFKSRVPDLAEGLKTKIEQAHKTNARFRQAFADFFELCKTSLNPNLSQEAVDEMLVQHILTERLIREIFDNPEFVRRNVIAAEVEKVMLAMTSESFDRNTYLKDLDRFYVAIERAARTMTEWSDKQYFLNTVYERFFQGYSTKLADTMGIVYTPQEIVDFMCASVAEVLEQEFGKTLASDDVYIIDPCTGTGNFVVNLLRRIPKTKLEAVYKKRLFANEIMLLPYYIAALNIEHAYYEQTGKYEPFEGLCFVDTLDLAEQKQGQFGFMTAANTQRVERQRRAPITVVIGNPPYNLRQQNENDNNRNRRYEVVDQQISATYAKDSKATSKMALSDPYVKFFRWAMDRLGDRDGVVAFVTNNSFVEQSAFDGMRKHLRTFFSAIYHLDLLGNVRHNPRLSGSAFNVFGIQVGVGITIAVRRQSVTEPVIRYRDVSEDMRRHQKLAWVASQSSVGTVEWCVLQPDSRETWIVPSHAAEFDNFLPIATAEAKRTGSSSAGVVFGDFTRGLETARDAWVYGFDTDQLGRRIASFVESYNGEVDRWRRAGRPDEIDDFVVTDETRIKWSSRLKESLRREEFAVFSSDKLRPSVYRPFTRKAAYFDAVLNHRRGVWPRIAPLADTENVTFCASGVGSERPFAVWSSRGLADLNFFGPGTVPQWYPFYVYDEDGSNRRENITDWALQQFRERYKDKKIDKWAIFHYVYGVLHHPGYREKFADNLKRELPRIPFAPDFRAFADAGKRLAALHLDYEQLEPWDLKFEETPGEPLSWRVDDKMRLSKDKTRLVVNKSLALSGIPEKVFEYRLGNRSALEWVIDQYQVHTDKRSGITSDPNRDDDPQYIVRLVGQVIRVSLETVAIVEALPAEFSSEDVA